MRNFPPDHPSPSSDPLPGRPAEVQATLALIADMAVPAAVAWGETRAAAFNAAFSDIIGDAEPDFSALWGDDWPAVSACAQGAIDGRPGVLENIALPGRPRSDRSRCVLSCSPVRVAESSRCGLLVILHQCRLSAEVGHSEAADQLRRVRNLSARMRAIVTRSAQFKPGAHDFVDHLVARSDTLFRIEAFVSGLGLGGADIEGLIRDELRFRAAPEHCFSLSGPELLLPPRMIEMLILTLHELATNSVQFGVLGGETGRIEIAWSLDRDAETPSITFNWRERPGPGDAIGSPGFGTEMITRMAPIELGGAGTFAVSKAEVAASISFPLGAAQSLMAS